MALVGLLVSALFLYLVFRQVDAAAVWDEVKRVDVRFLAASLLTKLLAFACITARSKVLLQPAARFPPRAVFKSHLVAFLGSATLPFRIGELLRVDYLARVGQVSRGGCLAVVAFERLLDVFWFLVLLAAVSPLVLTGGLGDAGLVTFAGAVLSALAVCWLVSRAPGSFAAFGKRFTGLLGRRLAALVDPALASFASGFAALRSPGRLAGVNLCTMGFLGASAGSVALWIRAFRLELPWFAPFVVIVFIALGVALPASPGAIGTYDYFAMQGLAVFGVGSVEAASFAIVGHAVALVPWTLIALIALLPELERLYSRAFEPIAEVSEAGG